MRQAPKTTSKSPVLTWSVGGRIVGTQRIFAGLRLDVGRSSEVDAAAEAAGWTQGQMQTMKDRATFWLPQAPLRVYLMLESLPYATMSNLARNAEEVAGYGIGASWPDGERSRLCVHVVVLDLLIAGYPYPLPISVSSTATDDLIAALLDHNRALDALEAVALSQGRKVSLNFHDAPLPIACGAEQVRGKGEVSEVTPMVSGHPAEITAANAATVGGGRENRALVRAIWQKNKIEIAERALSYATAAQRQG